MAKVHAWPYLFLMHCVAQTTNHKAKNFCMDTPILVYLAATSRSCPPFISLPSIQRKPKGSLFHSSAANILQSYLLFIFSIFSWHIIWTSSISLKLRIETYLTNPLYIRGEVLCWRSIKTSSKKSSNNAVVRA